MGCLPVVLFAAFPIGLLSIRSEGEVIREICFESQIPAEQKKVNRPAPSSVVQTAIEQLQAYFQGSLQEFDLPVAPLGTEFQLRVWEELQKIPYGETTSYGELARRVGSPKAARAVGLANGRNPIPIVIPCHRVIGSDGSLTGFGGGLATKQKLLELERVTPKLVSGTNPTHE